MRLCRSAVDRGDPQEHTCGRSGSDVRVSNEPYAGHRQKLTKTSAALRDGGMIFGNPYEFAILVEAVTEWSLNSYRNGLFHFFIDGKMFPDNVEISSLGADLCELLNSSALLTPSENSEIFHLDKLEAFSVMRRLTNPDFDEILESSDLLSNSYLYHASIAHIDDRRMKVFCVRYGDECRILGAKTAELVERDDGRIT